MKLKRLLFLLWLATESVLAAIGAFVVARSLLCLWGLNNRLAAVITVSLALTALWTSVWSHLRAEAASSRRASP